MISIVLKTIAIAMAGLMVGNELSVSAFVHPRLSTLDDKSHAISVQSLARVYGKVMPFWYAIVLALSAVVAIVLRSDSIATLLATTSTVLWISSIIFTLLFPLPINNQVIGWNLESLPENWKEQRQKWDRFHLIRVFIIIVAFVCLTVACLIAN
jgi:uncharacterized membrane protein